MINKIRKKLFRVLNRSHILYSVRFFLIMIKPSSKLLVNESYNDYNSKKDIPKIYLEENRKIQERLKGNTFERVMLLADYLRANYTGGRGLGLSSDETLKIMKECKGGVCSDYSQVFINFCILNDIKVREWGTHDTVYENKMGHVFNEVYIPELSKWVCVDVSKCIYFTDIKTGELLSAQQLIDMNVAGMYELININFFLAGKALQVSKLNLVKSIYLNPGNLFFLVTRYKIKKMDRMMKLNRLLPVPVLHFLMILKNDYYKYMLYINDKNHSVINEKIKPLFKRYEPLTFEAMA